MFPEVSQVPKNLEERDIQEAFEDIGRVTKCEAPLDVAVVCTVSPVVSDVIKNTMLFIRHFPVFVVFDGFTAKMMGQEANM